MESRKEPNDLPKAVADWIKAADELSSPSLRFESYFNIRIKCISVNILVEFN